MHTLSLPRREMDRIPNEETLYTGASESKGLEDKIASAILDARANGKSWTAVDASGYSPSVVVHVQERLETERGIGVYYSNGAISKSMCIVYDTLAWHWMVIVWDGEWFKREVDSATKRLDAAPPNTMECTMYRLVAVRVADALKRLGHAVTIGKDVYTHQYRIYVDPVIEPRPVATGWFACPWR
jgi:hypothetical protein